jgi:hypothetical protein
MIPHLSDASGLTATSVASLAGLFYSGYSPFSLVAGVTLANFPVSRPQTFEPLLYGVGLVPWNRDVSHNSRAGHPGWRRCSSLTYAQYARSSRLAIRAPRSGPYATHHGSRGLAIVVTLLLKETGRAVRPPAPAAVDYTS